MSLAARKWGSAVLLLWLWFAAGAPPVHSLDSSHGSTLTLTPSEREISLSTGTEVMCDPSGDTSLEAARVGLYVPLGSELLTADQCHGYWVRINLRTTTPPPGGWVLKLSREWWRADLYFGHDGGVPILRTGTALPPQDRAIASSSVPL